MTYLYIILGVVYLLGGPIVMKRSLAHWERYYLEKYPSQEVMDDVDWAGAIIRSFLAFLMTPLVILLALSLPGARPIGRALRSYLTPPVQKRREEHIREMDTQKEALLSTAREIAKVGKWRPDDEGKQQMLTQLQDVLSSRAEALAELGNPDSSFDKAYMAQVRLDVDDARRGLTKPSYKELLA